MAASTLSILSSIANTSRNLKSHIRGIGFRPVTRTLPISPPPATTPLDLPYPHDIAAKIWSSAIPSSIQTRIIAIVDQWYHESRRTLEGELAKTLSKIANLPGSETGAAGRKIQAVYESIFTDKMIAKLRRDIDEALQKALLNQREGRWKGKRPARFNHVGAVGLVLDSISLYPFL